MNGTISETMRADSQNALAYQESDASAAGSNETEYLRGLLNDCYAVFGKTRNPTEQISLHLDPKGYPTIGCGHLVYKPGQNIEDARKSYVEAMLAIGKYRGPRAAQEASDDFTAIVTAKNNGTIKTKKISTVNVVIFPKQIKLSPGQGEMLFKLDVIKKYNTVSSHFPQGVFKSFPRGLQIALLRTAYHGGFSRVTKSSNPQTVAMSMAKAWERQPEKKLNGKRGAEIAMGCLAVGIPIGKLPSKIQEAFYSDQGQSHFRAHLAQYVPSQYLPSRTPHSRAKNKSRTRGR